MIARLKPGRNGKENFAAFVEHAQEAQIFSTFSDAWG